MNSQMKNNRLAIFARHTYSAFLGRVAAIHARVAKPPQGKYDLSHLTQSDAQYVLGPVQDDEALFLYSVVRGMRMRSVLEVGGLSGYSALNFARALPPDAGGFVVTIDINPVRQVADNHYTVAKPCQEVTEDDLRHPFVKRGLPEFFDMVFFDAHHYDGQMTLLKKLQVAKLVNDDTILAFHDTDLHPYSVELESKFVKNDSGKSGFSSCDEERRMVKALADEYYAFQLHSPHNRLRGNLKFRHGITLLQKKRL